MKTPRQLFYGWWIVGATVIIALYIGGVVFYGFTAIFEPIVAEMGWSYTQMSFASSIRGLEEGIVAPFAGILVDRWGPKRLIFFGGALGAIGLFVASRAANLGMFYCGYILVAIGMSCCSMTVLASAINNWFRRKAGLATGIAVSGFGLSGVMIPLIVRLIADHGWRSALNLLGIGMLAIVLPFSLVFRHKPEQYGCLPDGDIVKLAISASTSSPGITSKVARKFRKSQLLKNKIFWQISVSFMLNNLMINAVATHVMPYLTSIGISRETASIVATALPITSVAGRLSFGWFADKFNLKRVIIIGFILIGIGMVLFGYISSAGSRMIIPFLAVYGIGYGGLNPLRPSMMRYHFGRENFGTIFGLMMSVNLIGSVVGPLIAGRVFDHWGNYANLWYVFAAASLIALIMVAAINKKPVETPVSISESSN